MRAAALLRLLLVPAALFAGACGDSTSPFEGSESSLEPVGGDPAELLGNRAHWADGFTFANNPTAASYSPVAAYSYNRSGGAINIRKPDATTGRYIATFTGLSALLGSKSTVHVSGFGTGAYCKPVAASLAGDKIEVRCFSLATGQPANAVFMLLVTHSFPDLAFAYAHQPTGTNYSPSASGSYNPVGGSTVIRNGVGRYQLVFNKLGAELPAGVGGHVQVGAVGTNGVHCGAWNWVTGATANLTVDVQCHTASGLPADSKFTVLFLVPADHLAYAWGDQPTVGSYTPNALYSSNPVADAMFVNRLDVGTYLVTWRNAAGSLFGMGHAQATAYGSTARCTVISFNYNDARVACFGPTGAPVDSRFTVLLGT